MANDDLGAQTYEYDWQNPKSNKFDFGRTFSRTMDIIKTDGLRMMIFSVVLIGLPVLLLNLWPMFMAGGLQDLFSSDDPSEILEMFTGGVLATLFFGMLLLIVASLWLQPCLVRLSYDTLQNKKASSGLVLKSSLKFMLPLFGFFILYILGVMAGMVLLIIPGLILSLGWMLGFQIMVLEEKGVFDSFGRAWELTKGYKWWMFLLVIVFGVIGAVISTVILIPVYLMEDPNLALLQGASPIYWGVNAIFTAIGQAMVTVLSAAWTTSTYVELRKIREGVDPESQVEVFN